MKKRILSLFLLGAIAVASLPMIGASAAEVKNFNIKPVEDLASTRVYVGTYYIDQGAYAYNNLPMSNENFAGRVTSTVKCAIYTNKTTDLDDANRKCYYVRCKVDGSSKYDFYYVYKSSVQVPKENQ
ncbi:hypothetical protein [Clostridium beijerinckii]|uniref:hypothetical protein n=1 Tax=Clostridium beijerinckii TaxID=1520 RepID=UPI00098C0395|nr:hypothetical protein [Clostridium beijerinckii]NRT80620.1 hypothetical protein [Clostridium beijerinckii]OOM37888.1 hypothetical protein CBEIJ_49380 [Clostridium beijerinckii]